MNFIEKKYFPIQYKILSLIVIILFLTLTMTAIIVERSVVHRFKNQLAKNARNIAYSVSEIPEIKRYIDQPENETIIKPIIDKIIKKTNVRYILAVGGDAEPVIEGFQFSEYGEVTSLGPTVRAYVPVFRDGNKVGAIAVYLWTYDINIMIWSLRKKIIFAVFLGLILGIFFAHFLAKNIKNIMFGMEPSQIASLLKEREALLESVKEGIVAVDAKGNISYVNRNARKILNISAFKTVKGEKVENLIPTTQLKDVISTGKAQYDREQIIGENKIITNRIPIIVSNKVYGAIASFRSIEEMEELAEELTGAQKLSEVLRIQNESLRVQKHQFLNKIHTIAGLLELKEYDEALDLIQLEVRVQQKEIHFISDNIKQTEVAGLILGKMGRCKELGIRFILSETSFLGTVSDMDTNSIVVCLGNIIENSIEAILSSDKKEREVRLLIKQTNNELMIKVTDTGIGIGSSATDILTKGFTTKKGGKRGYGLFIVKSTLDSLKGTINVDSKLGKGTTITLRIPEGQHYGY